MGDFSIIETGFNNADETINFGTRCFGIGNLYEISTVACLTSSTETKENYARINALCKNGYVILAVNKILRIFEDNTLTTLIFEAVFQSDIATLCTSNDFKYVLVVFLSGEIKFFLIADEKQRCIYSQTLAEGGICQGDNVYIFEETTFDYHSSFIIVLYNGRIFRFSVDWRVEASENNETHFEIVSEEICNLNCVIKFADYNYPNLIVNGHKFYILNTITNETMMDTLSNIKRCSFMGSQVILLFDNGSLLSICQYSLLPIYYPSIALMDMLVIEDDRNYQILGVYGEDVKQIKLLSSDFTEIFSLEIKHTIHLMECDNRSNNILFISKIFDDKSGLKELRLQSIVETEPELQLKRLLKRKLFSKAEEFANLFNMDPLIIIQSKAHSIVDKSETTSEDIDDLIQLMDQIDDEFFKLECCANVDCSSLADIRRILTYGNNIRLKPNSDNIEGIIQLKKDLSNLLSKFETYTTVATTDDIQAWIRFSAVSLMEEIQMYLCKEQIEEAIILYSRMDRELKNELTDKSIEEILNILDLLPSNVYSPFLPTFIPLTVIRKPTSLHIFVQWLYNKVIQMEKRDAPNFPENAIKFAGKIITFLKVDGRTSVLFQRQCTVDRKNLESLSILMEHLKMIKELKDKFQVEISLTQCLNSHRELIRDLFKISMSPEHFEHYLKDFLYGFIIRNYIDADGILQEEIRVQMTYEYSISIIAIILEYISSVQKKLETIHEILIQARVPWCAITRKIAQNALQYDHHISSEICKTLKEEPVIVVLSNPVYGLNIRRIQTRSEFDRVINRMIYVDHPSMMNDIRQLCQTTQQWIKANFIVIRDALHKGNLAKAYECINKLGSPENIYECLNDLLTDAEIIINSKHSRQAIKDNYYNSLGLFHLLVNNCQDWERGLFEDQLQRIKMAYNVNKTFQLEITTGDLRTKERKNAILDQLFQNVAQTVVEGNNL